MPLITISGYPCAGKTHRAEQLVRAFRERIAAADPKEPAAKLSVVLVNDQSLGVERAAYATAAAEKNARAAHASAVQRALGQNVVVVADAMNYIKGVRYQMNCEAKAARTPSCTVHVGTPIATCRAISEAVRHGRKPRIVAGQVVDTTSEETAAGDPRDPSDDTSAATTPTESIEPSSKSAEAPSAATENEVGGYEPELFDNLVFRYEEPDGRNRWDAPLFTVLPDDAHPPYDAIWAALVPGSGGGGSRPVRPNQATVLTPAAAPNALHALDRSTAAIASAVAAHLAGAEDNGGDRVSVPGTELAVQLPSGPVTAAQVQRLRREFVTLWRGHGTGIAAERAAEGFVRFLNARWGGEEDG